MDKPVHVTSGMKLPDNYELSDAEKEVFCRGAIGKPVHTADGIQVGVISGVEFIGKRLTAINMTFYASPDTLEKPMTLSFGGE